MRDALSSSIRRTRLGLVGVALSIVVSIVVTSIWGPLWGQFGWRVTAAALMGLTFLALAGVEEFLRPQNEYSRVHPMLGYQDLASVGELRSSDWGLLWAALPLLAGATMLLVSIWMF